MNFIIKDKDYEKILKKDYEDVKMEEAKRKKLKTKNEENPNKVKLIHLFS